MFGFVKKIFFGLLTSIVNDSSHTKCVSLSNQKFKIQSILINLHSSEYIQGLGSYPFTVNLDRCVGVLAILLTHLIKYVFQTKQKI